MGSALINLTLHLLRSSFGDSYVVKCWMGHLANSGFQSRGFVGRKTYTCSPKHLKNTLRVLAAFC